MKIVFTSHAKYRLMERGISFADVRTALLNRRLARNEVQMFKTRKKIGDKNIEIVYKIDKNVIVVITAYEN